MKVILKPVSHPQIGEISIDDELFAIGRNEEPFASGLGEAAARLSRRHARIFEEDGKVYIADLGSLNGTRINDQALKNGAAVLQHNDLVTFGNEVSFRVELQREVPKTMLRQSAVRLTLVPVDSGSGLENIAVERFPFLIARIDSAFEQYKERFPEALRQLSRRHAVITQKGDQIYIEDLESFNGTYVDGQRLDERARQLADGNTIMFGTQQFAYKAHVERPRDQEQTRVAGIGTVMAGPSGTVDAVAPSPGPVDAVAPSPGPVDAVAPSPGPVESQTGNRTRFVSSADSFINVFCAEKEQHPAADAAPTAEETAKVPALKESSGGLAGRLWRAVRGDANVDRRVIKIAVGVLAVIMVAGLSAYLIGFDRREIKSLLDDGKYEESALAANSYLKKHPDNDEVAAWGQEALARAVAPAWIALIEKQRFDAAAQYLQAQKKAHASIRRGQEMLDVLSWAGSVEAYMAKRGGVTGPVVMFRDEDLIKTLVGEWENDSARYQQLMDQVMTNVPAFEPVHSQVFGNLRELRRENSLYVKAIDQLKSDLGKALRDKDREAIDKLISDFASNYPRVNGPDALKQDAVQFDSLARLVDNKDLPELMRLRGAVKFRTPIFEDYVAGWLASELPPADIAAKHAAAANAWRVGKRDEAIAMLEPLKNQPWGEVAVRQIERYRKIGADYDQLVASRGTDRYVDNLLALWGSLRPQEDDYVIRELQPDFLAQKEKLVPRLEESYRSVRSSWDAYQRAGGIPGVIRVEGHVSAKFTEQAKRLSNAYDEVTQGARTYQLLQMTRPADWQALEEQVVAEARRQRRWLQDLSIVLEPQLLRAKLELLPKIPEEASWRQSTTARDAD
jgi:pSer/pThr/pTyr-binding forkhead associated (FHA) protein